MQTQRHLLWKIVLGLVIVTFGIAVFRDSSRAQMHLAPPVPTASADGEPATRPLWSITVPKISPHGWALLDDTILVHDAAASTLSVYDLKSGVLRRRMVHPGRIYDGTLRKALRGRFVRIGDPDRALIDVDSGTADADALVLNRWFAAGPPERRVALIRDENRSETLYLYDFTKVSRVWTTRALPGDDLQSQYITPMMAYAIRYDYVVTERNAISVTRELRGCHAFGLDGATGRDLWTFHDPGSLDIQGEHDGVICLAFYRDAPKSGTGSNQWSYAALEGRTGAVLWSLTDLGRFLAVRDDGFLFLDRRTVRHVDLRTGRVTMLVRFAESVARSIDGPLVLVGERTLLAGFAVVDGTTRIDAWALP